MALKLTRRRLVGSSIAAGLALTTGPRIARSQEVRPARGQRLDQWHGLLQAVRALCRAGERDRRIPCQVQLPRRRRQDHERLRHG